MRNKDLKILLKYAKLIWFVLVLAFISRFMFSLTIDESEIYFLVVKISNSLLQHALLITAFIGVNLIINLNFKRYEKPQRNA